MFELFFWILQAAIEVYFTIVIYEKINKVKSSFYFTFLCAIVLILLPLLILNLESMVDYFEYSYRGNDVRVPFNDILYIETTGSSHKLRIVGKNFLKEFYGTITDIQEKDQQSRRFFSPHKSYLVNIGNIVDYDKKNREIIFYENHRCPVTRLRVKYLKDIFENKGKRVDKA